MMAYWQLEPWGAWRDNWHSAQVASLLFNAFRGKKTEPAKVKDFMYRTGEEDKDNMTKATVSWLKMMAAANGD